MKTSLRTALPIVVLLLLPTPAFAVFNVGQGGTGQTAFPVGACVMGNGTNPLTTTYSPSFASINATSTTATSTFTGNVSIIGRLQGGAGGSGGQVQFNTGGTFQGDDRFTYAIDAFGAGLLTIQGDLNVQTVRSVEGDLILQGPGDQIGIVNTAGTISSLLKVSQVTQDRTFSFPDATGTFALLEASQTWTGMNIFNKGVSATTTINVGAIGSSMSRACFNTKNTTGDDVSFFIVGTTIIVEHNQCK